MSTLETDTRTEQFVRLLMASEHELFGYTYMLVQNVEDAREVMQDAAVAMWQHFAEYDADRPFFPWACKFAYFKVLNLRRKRRAALTVLSDEALEVCAQEYEGRHTELSERSEALTGCVEKLPAPARALLKHRYTHGQSVQEIARRTGRSVNTLYKAFDRIRGWLLTCLEQTIAREGQL